MNKKEIRKTLSKKCSLSDVKDICFDLEVDYDNIPGESKSSKIRELILYLDKKEELQLLEELINERFPIKEKSPKNIIPDVEEIEVMRLVAANKLDKAIDHLIKVIPQDASLMDKLIILRRRQSDIDQQIARNTIDVKDSSIELNKITEAILWILKKD
jgi:GTP-binding protein EngB required for normal cell division